MLLLVALKTLLLFAFVLAILAPLVAWLARRQDARVPPENLPDRAGLAALATFGWLEPAADAAAARSGADAPDAGGANWARENRRSHLLAPLLSSMPVLLAIAVIPFGGAYVVAGSRVELVIADIDWGLLYVMALITLGAYGPVVAGFASADPAGLLRGFRSAAQTLSYMIALGLCAAGVFMIYASLRLPEIAAAQDANFQPLAFIEILGWGTLPAWLAWVRLPYWGIFLQPLGFVLFFVCLTAANESPPFDAARAKARFGSFRIGELVQEVVTASIVATMFLGGFTIPFFSQTRVLAWLTPSWGPDAAMATCLIAHSVFFVAKVMLLVWVQLRARWSLARFPYQRVMDLCWKIVVPLALVNLVVTASLMRWLGAAP